MSYRAFDNIGYHVCVECSTSLFKTHCHWIPLIIAVNMMKLAVQEITQALRQFFDDLPPDVATCIQYIPPEETPRCSRAASCRGTGRVDILEFIRYDKPLEAAYNTKCLEYLRSGLCATCQRKPRKVSLETPLVDSIGRACQISVRPRGGVVIPQTAYRCLIDYLQCDPTFCNHAIPTFLPMGWVSLAFHDPRQSIRMQVTEPNVVAIPAKIEQPDACAHGQAWEVELPTEEGYDWNFSLDQPTTCLQFGWDGDYKFLGTREKRRRRRQAKRSVRNMRRK